MSNDIECLNCGTISDVLAEWIGTCCDCGAELSKDPTGLRYFKVELVVATPQLQQGDLIGLAWDTFTSRTDMTLVQNIVYRVSGNNYEGPEA